MTRPRALQLTRMTGPQAQALGVIARCGTNRLFTPQFNASIDMMRSGSDDARAEQVWHFGMRRIFPGNGQWQALCHADRCVGVAWNGATCFLRFPAHVCDDWLSARLPDLQLDALPPQFIAAAWEAMVADALYVLGLDELCAGIRITPEIQQRSHSQTQYRWALSIRPAHSARAIHAELATDDTGLTQLAGLLGRLPVSDCSRPSDSLSRLAVPVQAAVGMTTLDMAALAGIQVGDVVLLDRCLTTMDGGMFLTTPDGQGVGVRPCETHGSRYVVTREWNLLMDDLTREPLDEADDFTSGLGTDMRFDPPAGAPHDDPFATEPMESYGDSLAEPIDEPADSDPAGKDGPTFAPAGAQPIPCEAESGGNGLNVDRIPVRLTFDLGEQMLTLGELRRLQPGEYFDLQRRLDAGPLHMRANGSLIGTAELVDIEGRVGARILTLTLDRGSCH
jgi:type III secretion system YscQ/HrcQ family protein